MRVAPLDSSWIGRKLGIIFAPTRNRPDPGPEAIHRSHPGYPETRAAWQGSVRIDPLFNPPARSDPDRNGRVRPGTAPVEPPQ